MKALVARHIGPYDTVYKAYQAINQYAAAHGLKLAGPSREMLVKGPNIEENPSSYITDVVVPIE